MQKLKKRQNLNMRNKHSHDKYLNRYTYIVTGLVTLIIFIALPEGPSKITANIVSSVPEAQGQEQTQIQALEPTPSRASPVIKKADVPLSHVSATPQPPQIQASSTPQSLITAQAAYAVDLQTGEVLYEKNAHTALPLASLTKIMMALTALELTSGSSSPTVTISKASLDQSGDSGLLVDEQWNLTDLLKYTLVVSSNDGAYAIGSGLGISRGEFIKKMNERAHSLGLQNTKFMNESGLDVDGDLAGAYGTAQDVTKLLGAALELHTDIFTATRYPSITVTSKTGILHKASNTDVLVQKIPGIIAGKTGYTLLAGGNLAILYTDSQSHHTIAVAVLGSTYDGRFADMQAVIQHIAK